uniref:Retrotransposon gag domain-containing protein n=1 Tax=Tanacetum cinerariifolium TaxID=118510 RepID=A0A6L2MUW2_TANCI|nr:hypothetical protein [Tanacetum cinerariifolium]
MAETMEQYMRKTRADYGSRVARPKIKDKDNFKLKGQFLKELRDNTFSGSDHEDANEHIEKFLEIVDLFHIPNITIDQEDLKTKFQSKYCPPTRTAKKLEDINKFQQESDENLYQAWEQFKELLMKFPQHFLIKMHEVLLFYNGLDVPSRQILDSRGAIPSKTIADTKVAIQEMAEYSQIWHNGTSRTRRGGYRAIASGFYQRNNNSNLVKEIRASTDAAIRNQGASIKTLEIQIGQMSKVLQEKGFRSLPNSIKTNPRDHFKSIPTIVEADSYPIHRMGFSQYVVSTEQNRTLLYETKQMKILFPSCLNGYYCKEKKKDLGSFTLPCFINNVCFDNALADLGASISVMPLSTYLNLGLDFIILYMLEDIKVPLILETPFLSTAHAKIDVFKRKITLRVGGRENNFQSIKPTSSLIKRVYMLSLKERMDLNLEARLMRETLVLNRSLDPFFRDYIELNDLNVPLELRRDQVDDVMPTIKEGEVVEDFRAKNDTRMIRKILNILVTATTIRRSVLIVPTT